MIESVENKKNNCLLFRVNGKQNQLQMEAIASTLQENTKYHGKLRLYLELFSEASPGEVTYNHVQFGFRQNNTIGKAAIICTGISPSLKHPKKMLAGMEIRIFVPSQRQQALQWLEQRHTMAKRDDRFLIA